MKRHYRFNSNGQLLLEVLVALGVIVVGLLSVFGFIARGLSMNRLISDQFTGAYLATEGVEVVKNIIDGNFMNSRPWNTGFQSGDFEAVYSSTELVPDTGRKISYDDGSGYWQYEAGDATNFSRTIRVRMIGSDEIQVNSIVRWAGRGGPYEVDVEDHFYNWIP